MEWGGGVGGGGGRGGMRGGSWLIYYNDDKKPADAQKQLVANIYFKISYIKKKKTKIHPQCLKALMRCTVLSGIASFGIYKFLQWAVYIFPGYSGY